MMTEHWLLMMLRCCCCCRHRLDRTWRIGDYCLALVADNLLLSLSLFFFFFLFFLLLLTKSRCSSSHWLTADPDNLFLFFFFTLFFVPNSSILCLCYWSPATTLWMTLNPRWRKTSLRKRSNNLAIIFWLLFLPLFFVSFFCSAAAVGAAAGSEDDDCQGNLMVTCH